MPNSVSHSMVVTGSQDIIRSGPPIPAGALIIGLSLTLGFNGAGGVIITAGLQVNIDNSVAGINNSESLIEQGDIRFGGQPGMRMHGGIHSTVTNFLPIFRWVGSGGRRVIIGLNNTLENVRTDLLVVVPWLSREEGVFLYGIDGSELPAIRAIPGGPSRGLFTAPPGGPATPVGSTGP